MRGGAKTTSLQAHVRSTRPFLEGIEKRWLAFQLLSVIRDCHANQLYHGDIKSENILVTSWNWLYLADFSSSFKPAYLPEDNPAEFSFYFDIAGRRTCYLAPERFLGRGETQITPGPLNWAMDIFSVGCVIAELFLEAPIFNLSQLFNYKKGDYDPVSGQLQRIDDTEIQEIVAHMIQLEPESRYSADEYLNFWRGRAFPDYFSGFLHQYMALITDPSSGRTAITGDETNLGESDDRIARVYSDYDKIAYFLEYTHSELPYADDLLGSSGTAFPVHVDLPTRRPITKTRTLTDGDEGTYLFLNIVTSSLRSTARSTARMQACDLLLAFSEHISDEAKMDRVLPFIITLLDDSSEMVRVVALRSVAQLTGMITSTSPVNAFVFPEYILPKLAEMFLPRRNRPRRGVLVRLTLAQCIAPLAEAAAKFLDSIEALKSEGSLPSVNSEVEENESLNAYQDYYDQIRMDLVRFFESQAKRLLTDDATITRRTFLGSIASLCVFFGSAKTSDVILSHLNTYLNDRDWMLKTSFLDAIVGVAVYVGSNSLEEFILPLMLLALPDTEEAVLVSILRSLATMASLGLFQKGTTSSLIDLVGRFSMHPNQWVREAAVDFLASAVRFFSPADRQCTVMPLLGSFLRLPPTSFEEVHILDALKKPIRRDVYDLALAWAANPDGSKYWRHIRNMEGLTKDNTCLVSISSKDLSTTTFAKAPKDVNDQKWVNKLRDAGLSREDEAKLLALSEYIWQIARKTPKEPTASEPQILDKQLKLNDLGVPVNTFQVDVQDDIWERESQAIDSKRPDLDVKPQTISDALLDASVTIGARDELQRAPTDAIARNTPRTRDTGDTGLSTLTSPTTSLPSDTEHANLPTGGHIERNRKEVHQISRKAGRSSAVDLIQRGSIVGKASPELGTSGANAQGRVNNPPLERTYSGIDRGTVQTQEAPHILHSKLLARNGYGGRDPNVLRLLESLAAANHPPRVLNFGPEINPITKRSIRQKTAETTDGSKRRSTTVGATIAMFSEHTAPITRLLVSPDHAFFITGSEDGSVKIWDTNRLERNVAHRSRQTYKHAPGAKVTALCFIENSHTFASAGSDGSIHLVRVDCAEIGHGVMKYKQVRLLRQWKVPAPRSSHALWIEHIKEGLNNRLMIATNNGEIHAMSIESAATEYSLQNPLSHGTPTCFCIGRGHQHWLLVGTSIGVLDLWDLRFHIRLKSFAFPDAAPITRIALHPRLPEEHLIASQKDDSSSKVYISGGVAAPEVTAWDLAEMKCVGTWRMAGGQLLPDLTGPDAKKYSLLSLNYAEANFAPKHGQILRSAAASPNRGLSSTGYDGTCSVTSVQAFVTGLMESESASTGAAFDHSSYLYIAGPQCSLRLWNLRDVDHSFAVAGLPRAGTEEIKPAFTHSGVWSGISFNDEILPGSANADKLNGRRQGTASDHETGPGTSQANHKNVKASQGKSNEGKKDDTALGASPDKKFSSPRLEQQNLLREHLDVVTDVAIIDKPYRMFVSADRGGAIFVFA